MYSGLARKPFDLYVLAAGFVDSLHHPGQSTNDDLPQADSLAITEADRRGPGIRFALEPEPLNRHILRVVEGCF